MFNVVILEPNKEAYVKDIGEELKDLQEVVGGYIEIISSWDNNVCLIGNEEGLIHNLPPNRGYHGTLFCIGTRGENFCSLTKNQISSILVNDLAFRFVYR